jgi:hypothetical protein
VGEIAEFLHLSEEEFTERYTILTGDRRNLSLTEGEDGYCVFLTRDGACKIQPVKPNQCRMFPNFWSFPGFREKCEAIDTWEEANEGTD